MVEVVCSCGRTLKTRDENAGKTGRCPACGTATTFPAVAASGDPGDWESTDDDPWLDLDPAATVAHAAGKGPALDPAAAAALEMIEARARPASVGAGVVGGAAAPEAPEPWYYRAIAGFAWASIALAIGQVALCLLLAMKGAAERPEADSPMPEAVWRVPYSLGALVGTCLVAAPTLLVVDLARNVRAIRRQVAVIEKSAAVERSQ
jgi:hypothetical protein